MPNNGRIKQNVFRVWHDELHRVKEPADVKYPHTWFMIYTMDHSPSDVYIQYASNGEFKYTIGKL